MSYKRFLIYSIIGLAILISLDILVRVFYYTGIYLQFDSQQFNNIATPFISLFGFIGLIFTVSIALNQFKLQQSSSYFEYYRSLMNKILAENKIGHSTIELLDFVSYAQENYSLLRSNQVYMTDMSLFKIGRDINSSGKNYDKLLGAVRLFRTQLSILLKRYELLLKEIQGHKFLSDSHKDLLFKELFSNQILPYIHGLRYIDTTEQLKEMKENLYIAFAPFSKDIWPFFDDAFYDLQNFVNSESSLSAYLEYQL